MDGMAKGREGVEGAGWSSEGGGGTVKRDGGGVG